tara:strand:- start:194 stop:1282 length:1089 start_codon:yes stop_codon:yes gene_type:complete
MAEQKSLKSFLEDIDVLDIPLSSDQDRRVKDIGIAEKMDRDLETAFRNFYNFSQTRGADPQKVRNMYSQAVQSVRARDPSIFDEYFLDPNTEEKIQALNEEAFSDKLIPSTKEESEKGVMSLNIPFGSEGDPYIGGRTGLKGASLAKKDYGADETFVAGMGLNNPEPRSTVLRHEARHLLFDKGDPEKTKRFREEELMRQFDVLDAVLSQSPEKLEFIFDAEYGKKLRRNPEGARSYQNLFNYQVKTRLEQAVKNLPVLYDAGVFDKSKADKQLVKEFLTEYDKDEQETANKSLGQEPEQQEEVKKDFIAKDLKAKELARILSTAPFVTDSSFFGSFSRYEVDREEAVKKFSQGGIVSVLDS